MIAKRDIHVAPIEHFLVIQSLRRENIIMKDIFDHTKYLKIFVIPDQHFYQQANIIDTKNLYVIFNLEPFINFTGF